MGWPRWPDTEWWLACVEGLPRWLWAIALLWVGVLAAWARWVEAQTGRSADCGSRVRARPPDAPGPWNRAARESSRIPK